MVAFSVFRPVLLAHVRLPVHRRCQQFTPSRSVALVVPRQPVLNSKNYDGDSDASLRFSSAFQRVGNIDVHATESNRGRVIEPALLLWLDT